MIGWITNSLSLNCSLPLLGDIWLLLFEGQTICPYWGTFDLSFLRDKQFALIERHLLVLLREKQFALIGGHIAYPFWGTNSLPLLGDIWLVLFEGQTACPYWGTFGLPFLRDIHFLFPNSVCPYWETFDLSFFRDTQFALIGGHLACPFWGKQFALIGWHLTCPIWGTNSLLLLGDKQVVLFEGQTFYSKLGGIWLFLFEWQKFCSCYELFDLKIPYAVSLSWTVFLFIIKYLTHSYGMCLHYAC